MLGSRLPLRILRLSDSIFSIARPMNSRKNSRVFWEKVIDDNPCRIVALLEAMWQPQHGLVEGNKTRFGDDGLVRSASCDPQNE